MKNIAVAAAIAVLAISVYFPTLDGEFVFDDHLQIAENDQLRSLAHVPGFWVHPVWAAAGLDFGPYYRPMMYTSFALETAIAGKRAPVFRTTNALLHAGACVVLFALLLRCGFGALVAGLSAALFAVHPMHAEVVAWPSARPELLYTLFSLAAAHVAAAADPETGLRPRQLLLMGFWLALGLFSKETAVLGAVLVGVVLFYRAASAGVMGRLRFAFHGALPLLALFAAFIALRVFVTGVEIIRPLVGEDGTRFPFRSGLEAGLGLAGIAGAYFGNMALPLSASSFALADSAYLRQGLLLVPVALAAAVLAPRFRSLGWLAFAFVGVLIQTPAMPLAPLYQRYAYFPSVGICVFFGVACGALIVSNVGWRRALGGAAALALGVGWTALAVPRALEWRDDDALWAAAYRRTPDSPAVRGNFAHARIRAGKPAEAVPLFQQLIDARPAYFAGYFGLAEALAAMGQHEAAVVYYERAIERKGDIWYLYLKLADAHEADGNSVAAREVYARARALFPESAIAAGSLANLELRQGNPAEALAAIDAALSARPDDTRLLLNRIVALATSGRVDEAIAASDPLTRDTDTAVVRTAHRNLAVIFAYVRPDAARAREHFDAYVAAGGDASVERPLLDAIARIPAR